MFVTLRFKIVFTVLTIVLLFTFFTLLYFPSQQRRFLLNSYNSEVQNLSNTVALGVRIALNEQNYKGVQTAMEFVKGNPHLRYVSLLQFDTVWNSNHSAYQLKKTVFKTFPEQMHPDPNSTSNDSIIVKQAAFRTPFMSGAVLLGFSTDAITKAETSIFFTSLAISALIFFIGVIIALWFAHSISAPVLALRNAASQVSKGDLTPVVRDFSRDEVGDLAIAFNTMVQELASSREKLHAANRELTETNATLNQTVENLKATQQQLIHSEKMASLGELTAGIAHEIQNPLNFVNNFSEVNMELSQELKDELGKTSLPVEQKQALQEIAYDLVQNHAKIAYHGKRADSIVKAMLQHSRRSDGVKEFIDINALVDEYLRLSYHGLRAKDKSFNAKIETHFEEAVGQAAVVRQDVGRVLLNLFNNAFYAVQEKKKYLNGDFEPQVRVETRKTKNGVRICVKDNGVGIPDKIKGKLFQPFFTTKPAGEGTGLGLSLSYEIITKGHGGEIKVETQEGEGTTFIVHLPYNS